MKYKNSSSTMANPDTYEWLSTSSMQDDNMENFGEISNIFKVFEDYERLLGESSTRHLYGNPGPNTQQLIIENEELATEADPEDEEMKDSDSGISSNQSSDNVQEKQKSMKLLDEQVVPIIPVLTTKQMIQSNRNRMEHFDEQMVPNERIHQAHWKETMDHGSEIRKVKKNQSKKAIVTNMEHPPKQVVPAKRIKQSSGIKPEQNIENVEIFVPEIKKGDTRLKGVSSGRGSLGKKMYLVERKNLRNKPEVKYF